MTDEQIEDTLEYCPGIRKKDVLALIKRQREEKEELHEKIANGLVKTPFDDAVGRNMAIVMVKQLWNAVYALCDMVLQFGYTTTFRKKDALCDGGLSALETAFAALEWCGCPTNSNGTITVEKLLSYMDKINTEE